MGIRLNDVFAENVPRDELVNVLRPVLAYYRDQRRSEEPFGDFCHRLGVDRLRAQLGSERWARTPRDAVIREHRPKLTREPRISVCVTAVNGATMGGMKRLHLLRHAKSDWSDPSLADHDRPLNRRGKRTRKVIARHVAGWSVDLVLPTAVRTRASAKPVIDAVGCAVRYQRALYAADGRDLFELVRAVPDDMDSVMLIGHNPSLEELTAMLCGSSPRYPTAALGKIEFTIDHWAEVAPGSGTLTAHLNPTQLQAG